MSTLAELRAISLLVWRQWLRGRFGRQARAESAPAGSRFSGLLLRAVFVAIMANMAHSVGGQATADAGRAYSGALWLCLGLGLFCFGQAYAIELPLARSPASALKSPLLDQLPLGFPARLSVALGQLLLWAVVVVVGVQAAALARADLGVGPRVALGLLLFLASSLSGLALNRVLRMVLSPIALARSAWVGWATLSAATIMLIAARSLPSLPVPIPVFGSLALALTWPVSPVLAALELAGLSAVAVLVLYSAERRGYDHSDPVPLQTRPRAHTSLSLSTAPGVLLGREPGGKYALIVGWVMLTLFTGALAYVGRHRRGNELDFVMLLAAQFTLTQGWAHAARAAARDVVAAPLLGTLPIQPSATLAGKTAMLRRLLLPFGLSPLLLLFGARDDQLPLLIWRCAALLAGIVLYAGAAISVAFLTVGLGSAGGKPSAFGTLDSILVALPFMSAVLTPSPVSAAISLVALFAVSFEARRSALLTLDWFHDPEAARATPIWRALLVFAAFQALQVLLGRLVHWIAGEWSDAAKLALVYAISGSALLLMTERSQTAASKLSWSLSRLPWGLVAGLVSGVAAIAYGRLLRYLGMELPATDFSGQLELALLSLAVVGLAPLVEERFFRGWLQPLLVRDIGRGWLAVLVCAFAFAAAHPVVSFVPVFVLGLLTGLLGLYARSLAACVAAHALHNAIALTAVT